MRALALALVVLALAGCGDDDSSTTAEAPAGTGSGRESLVIQTDGGPVEVHAEIADSDAERQTGLMNRTSLDEDGGMLFVFDNDVTAAFWMKDTLIPLSIAFIDANGEIVTIRDMEPCEADPCPTYASDAPYRHALEVNQGAFDDWGVQVGDRVEIP